MMSKLSSIVFALSMLTFATSASALMVSGRQTAPNEWTYDLTYDPWDNYCIFQPAATISLTGLYGVVDATWPSSTDFPFAGLDQLNRGWSPQVLDGGTRVVWTHQGPGTGNFTTPMHVYGFKIRASNAAPGLVNLVTNGFSYDTHTPLGNGTNRDIALTVDGPAAPGMEIEPLSASFVSSDVVKFSLKFLPNTPVTYRIDSSDTLQTTSLATGQVTTDANGDAVVEIRPSSVPAFVVQRNSQWTGGSGQANPPINLVVTASASVGNAMASATGTLSQDENDILRQEYLDFGLAAPSRTLFVPNTGIGDQGSYGVQLSASIPKHYDEILAAYRRLKFTYRGKVVQVPPDAVVVVASGYRNPRRNALYTTNRLDPHTKGRALDLTPMDFNVTIGGQSVVVPARPTGFSLLNSVLKERLGYNPIPEHAGRRTTLGLADVLHIQW